MEIPHNRWFIKEDLNLNGWFGGTYILGNLHLGLSENVWKYHTIIQWFIITFSICSTFWRPFSPNFGHWSWKSQVLESSNPIWQGLCKLDGRWSLWSACPLNHWHPRSVWTLCSESSWRALSIDRISVHIGHRVVRTTPPRFAMSAPPTIFSLQWWVIDLSGLIELVQHVLVDDENWSLWNPVSIPLGHLWRYGSRKLVFHQTGPSPFPEKTSMPKLPWF